MSIRVLPLEPDQWRYLGILRVLTSGDTPEFEVLGEPEYKKCLTLRKAPADLDPDVVMVARSLVGDFKLPLLGRIRELFPRAHVLVHGYASNITRIADFLAAGATGYFLLSRSPDELAEAVKHVAKGLVWAPSEAVTLMVERMRRPEGAPAATGSEGFITPHELTLLKLLNDGLTNKEIASTVGVAEVTIKAQLTKLYKRFNIRTRLQLLAYAMKHELILGERPRTPTVS
jgi:two-component system response regulator DevR